jgi:prohibitin 2
MRLLLLISALMLPACGMTTVDTGHRGVEVHFGKVVSESMPEGLYFYNPFTTDIVQLDTRIQRWESNTDAYTKDVQQAAVTFVLNYHLEPAFAHTTLAQTGTDWANKLLPQVVYQSVKDAFGHWEAVQVVENRQGLQSAMAASISAELADKHIILDNFSLTNVDYNNEFEHAVETKVVAVQNAIAEQNRTVQKQELGKQIVIEAQANAQSISIRAEALSRNQQLVQWEAVQKWDGKLPQYMLGDDSVPFISITPTK